MSPLFRRNDDRRNDGGRKDGDERDDYWQEVRYIGELPARGELFPPGWSGERTATAAIKLHVGAEAVFRSGPEIVPLDWGGRFKKTKVYCQGQACVAEPVFSGVEKFDGAEEWVVAGWRQAECALL